MKLFLRKAKAFFLSASLTIVFLTAIFIEVQGAESAIGIGKIEGSVDKDIFQVVLPVNTSGVFDFIIDPQGLAHKTNGVAYGGKKFEDNATLYFFRSDGETEYDYCSTSDAITIVNNSSIPVEVVLTACMEPSSQTGIKMTEDKEFVGDTDTSLYLALTDGVNTAAVKDEEGASIYATIPAAPEEAFEYVYDSDRGEYIYKLKEDLSGIVFPEYSFRLTGASNEKGDWSATMGVAPKVRVKWTVMPCGNVADSGEGGNSD